MQMQRYRMIILRLPHCLCSFSIFKLCIIFVLLFIIITISPASRSDYRPKIQLILWFFNLNFQIIAEGLQCFFFSRSRCYTWSPETRSLSLCDLCVAFDLGFWWFWQSFSSFGGNTKTKNCSNIAVSLWNFGTFSNSLSGSFFSSISENKILFFFFFFQT